MLRDIIIMALVVIFTFAPVSFSMYFSGNDKDHIDTCLITLLVESIILGWMIIERIN